MEPISTVRGGDALTAENHIASTSSARGGDAPNLENLVASTSIGGGNAVPPPQNNLILHTRVKNQIHLNK